jgi:signal peptidase
MRREVKPSLASRLGGIALNIAAVGGVVCIALVILATVFHVTLVMFKTGSMTPTIPAGSVAVVREIPAADVSVGDIVTIARPGALPITHRVTSISPADGDNRSITMRGDANATEDPQPYLTSSVRLVVFSVPELARIIVWFSNPYVLGGITLAAAALVTWSFWAKDDRGRTSPRGTRVAVSR